eukprot:8751823-Alexandrium_andersonii.AAC.1
MNIGSSRCAGRATKADSPREWGWTRSTEAHGPPQIHPKTSAILWAKICLRGNSGRREAAPQ